MPTRKELGTSAAVGKPDVPGVTSTSIRTALHMAAEAGNEANVQSILNKSVADINRRCGSNGQTPLYRAAMKGHDHIVRILLAHSADPEVASVDGGYLPLHIAAERGYVDVVKALILGGARIQPTLKNGMTALHKSAEQGKTTVIALLLEHHLDANARGGDHGYTPLYQASMNGYHDAIKLLLENGADPNISNTEDGFTPLLIAAEKGHDLAVQALLSGGADIRAKATKGWTALHLAAQNGHGEVVARLLEHDVDINAQGGRVGQTPLYNAAFRGHDHIIKLLLDKGADPRKRTTEKLTAADIAAQFGHKSCEKLLRNRMGLSSIFARLTSTSR